MKSPHDKLTKPFQSFLEGSAEDKDIVFHVNKSIVQKLWYILLYTLKWKHENHLPFF